MGEVDPPLRIAPLRSLRTAGTLAAEKCVEGRIIGVAERVTKSVALTHSPASKVPTSPGRKGKNIKGKGKGAGDTLG